MNRVALGHVARLLLGDRLVGELGPVARREIIRPDLRFPGGLPMALPKWNRGIRSLAAGRIA